MIFRTFYFSFSVRNYSANRLFESPAARNLSNLNKSNKSIQKKI